MILGLILSKSQILLLAAGVGVVIVIWSFMHWRAAVKAALLAALFEGAIRKWGLPQGQEAVYFLKDIILAGAYIRFFLYPDTSLRHLKLRPPVIMLVMAATAVCLAALNPNLNSVIAALFGVKMYLYYIPLAFMVPFLYRNEAELVRSVSWLAPVILLISLIGVLQFAAPSSSILNVYAQQAGEEVRDVAVFGATGFARITGTFSYLSGLVVFEIVAMGVLLGLITTPGSRFRKLTLWVVLPLLGATAFMSGSRAAVIGQLLVILAFISMGTVYRLSKSNAVVGPVAMTVVLITLAASVVFRSATVAFLQRSVHHEAREELLDRLAQPLTSISDGLNEGGLTGYGTGVTIPATDALRRFLDLPDTKLTTPLSESELYQVAVELGGFGFFAWYGMRLMLLWSTFSSLRLASPGFVRAMILVSLVFQTISFTGQVVGNHTANFLYWLTYGFALIPTLHAVNYGRRSQAVRHQPAPSGR